MMFTKSAGPVTQSLLAFGRNVAAPAFRTGAAPVVKGVGEAGRGALNSLWSASKATGTGLYNYALKPAGKFITNPKVRQGLLNGAGRALSFARKGYMVPYTASRGLASLFGASPRLAGAIGGGTLAATYLGREALRSDGQLDLTSPGTYGNILINPVRDSYNIAAGGLGSLFAGEDDDAGIAAKKEVGATDADAQRAAHAAQNAGVTATPNIA